MRSYYDVFSAAQAVTVTAYSTSVLQTTGLGNVPGLMLFCRVSTAFANATSMKVGLETGISASCGTLIYETDVILEASLVAGYWLIRMGLPANLGAYARLVYTVDGTHNAGAVEAWIGPAETGTH